MLDELLDLTVQKPRRFGPLVWGLNRDEIRMQIAKIRASLPQEVKQAAHLARDTEKIVESAREDAEATLAKAQREAERLVADAHKQAQLIREQALLEQERLVSENEVLKLAKHQADQIRSAAERDALQLRRGAEDYAFQVLVKLEGVVGKVMSTIERGKSEIAPSFDTAPARDRTRA